MTDAPLLRTTEGSLAILTLNNPPANIFDTAMFNAWDEAVRDLYECAPRALLIRGAGRIVSSGVDVEMFANMDPADAKTVWARYLGITQAIEQLPYPTVFAAHSLTLTAAFEIALACDLIVATKSARFGLVERKVGFTPAMGGTQRLAQQAGPSRARELVMTGNLYRGEQLADWGVVNALFEPDTFGDDASAYAQRLAAGPTQAHAATKRVVRAYVDGGVAEADIILPGVVAKISATADHRAAVAAFLAEGPEHNTIYSGL